MAKKKEPDRYVRPDGLVEKQVTINGKRKRFRAASERELIKKIAAYTDEIEKGRLFSVVAEEWKDKHFAGLSYGTISCYNPALTRAIDALGDIPCAEVTAGDVDQILLRLKAQGLSAKTVKTQKTVLNMIFNYAIIEGDIKHNPVTAVSLPKNLPRSTREAPEDDVIKIIQNSVSAYFGLFPYLLLYTGCRKGEALALKWSDIDRKNKVIRINKSIAYKGGMPYVKEPKTEAGVREVLLLDDLLRALPPENKTKKDDWVFSQENGNPLAMAAYERRWKHYCKETGLVKIEIEQRTDKNGRKYPYKIYTPTLTAHQLRHAYATILFECGIDEFTAMNLLGHANITTTRQIYTHLRQKKRHDAAKTINDHLKSISNAAAKKST